MKTVYKLEHDWSGNTVTVEVDTEKLPDNLLEQINGFWCGAEDRLDDADADLLVVVLKLLAETVFRCLRQDEGMDTIELFEVIEGWPPMDGTYGLRIIDTEIFEIDADDISIQKMASA